MKSTRELKKKIIEQLDQVDESDNRFLSQIYVIIKVHLKGYRNNRDN